MIPEEVSAMIFEGYIKLWPRPEPIEKVVNLYKAAV